MFGLTNGLSEVVVYSLLPSRLCGTNSGFNTLNVGIFSKAMARLMRIQREELVSSCSRNAFRRECPSDHNKSDKLSVKLFHHPEQEKHLIPSISRKSLSPNGSQVGRLN
ncbi:hypothetical protein Tco_1314246 [Tanacetum coccineum]